MSFGASKRGAFGSTSADTEPSAVAPDPRGNPNYDLIRRSRQPLTGSPPRPMDPAIVLGSVTAVLLSFENRRALLDEGARAFTYVVSCKQGGEELRFQCQTFLDR